MNVCFFQKRSFR